MLAPELLDAQLLGYAVEKLHGHARVELGRERVEHAIAVGRRHAHVRHLRLVRQQLWRDGGGPGVRAVVVQEGGRDGEAHLGREDALGADRRGARHRALRGARRCTGTPRDGKVRAHVGGEAHRVVVKVALGRAHGAVDDRLGGPVRQQLVVLVDKHDVSVAPLRKPEAAAAKHGECRNKLVKHESHARKQLGPTYVSLFICA